MKNGVTLFSVARGPRAVEDMRHFSGEFKRARSVLYCSSYGPKTSAPGASLISPRICGGSEFLNGAHVGRSLPFGSPVLAKFTQYDEIISATARSFSDAAASRGELVSGMVRGAPRLSNTYGISAAWVAFRLWASGSTGGSCVKKYQ